MYENTDTNSSPSQNNDFNNAAAEYFKRAAAACASGDSVLGMHLYLAAFEQAQRESGSVPSEDALRGLKQAWQLACGLKERSIAEYVFERMEPYLSPEETSRCAEQLQDLAFDKLEEFGLSREDLEDMTDMISQDLLGIEGPQLLRVEHLTSDRSAAALSDSSRRDAQASAVVTEADPSDNNGEVQNAALSSESPLSDDPDSHAVMPSIERISYHELVGYDEAVALMRDFGVGMDKDANFQELVSMLNDRHGFHRMPAADTLLFRSPAREDANRFMAATLGELGLPALRMHMEENLQGMPILCVMAQADCQPKLNATRNSFEGAGVLMLEDLDLWISPVLEPSSDDFGGLLFASLSRGAREAITLIRSAVENPDVFVLATASEAGEIDPFFYDLLEPLSIVDIDYPTASERADIWMEIARDHPSLRGIDREALVRYSVNMPRYDMYMAAREAIEEAYKASLVARRYLPVTSDNLFDKLAAYQPLDSEEYRALEDAVVNDFKRELDQLEDLLRGEN